MDILFSRFQTQLLWTVFQSLIKSRTMVFTNKESELKEIKAIQKRIKTCERNANAAIQNLKTHIRFEEEKLFEDLTSYIRNSTDTLLDTHEDVCAQTSEKWTQVAQEANDIIKNIIAKKIDQWENEHQPFQEIKTRILVKFKEECQVSDDHIKEIESIY